MELRGGAAERLHLLLPPGARAQIHLTMTDEPPWAQAFVILSAIPAGSQALSA